MELPEIIENNFKKLIIGVVVVLGVIILFVALLTKTKSPMINIASHNFNLYLAENEKEKQIGLSKYESLPESRGMLFVFDKADYYPFWMKGMKFPIDIIYIKDNKVVTVFKNLRAENSDSLIYYPSKPADKVLEINAGLSEKYGIKEGGNIKTKNL